MPPSDDGGRFAPLPDPPYYAVIFAAQRREEPGDGYGEMADAMVRLAAEQLGYLGIESTRDAEGFGITVSYWRDEAALVAWKSVARHALAQRLGKERWYEHYSLRVARIERHYDGPEGR